MKNDHIHLHGEIKTIQWSADGLPESVLLDTNTRIETPLSSLIDPAALVEGTTIDVDGETNLQSMLASVHHAQIKVDGRLVVDGTQGPSNKGSKKAAADTAANRVRLTGHVQSIAFQMGGAIDHIVLSSGIVVRIDPCCEISDDLCIGDSVEVIATAQSASLLQAESVNFVKNAH